MADLFKETYNPDVLSCLANLSNDEVFTPPEVANQVLDMLPDEIWEDPDATFLDPACKSGIFLREIAKRLIAGLEDKIPDLGERLEHIYRRQLFGIATTELCSLLSRRSLYCSKYPNSKYSVVRFDTAEGNVRYRRTHHTWKNGRCVWCGAAKVNYDRDENLEQHAYEFIHPTNLEEIKDMKFDVIVGNPPYQLSDGGNGASASPIYQLFVSQAIKLAPRYLIMITPSRWLAGGKGLTKFREDMLSNRHIRKLVDYINAKDCFPQNSVSGGVSYFLWDRDAEGDCEVTTIIGPSKNTMTRSLKEFPVFVRQNGAVSIVRKVLAAGFPALAAKVSSRNPFGLPTSERGHEVKSDDDLLLISSKGRSYIARDQVDSNEYVDSYKVLISRITYEHAGEPDRNGQMRVLSRIEVLKPGEVCTDSYLVVGPYETLDEAEHVSSLLKSKIARLLIAQALTSINLSRDKFVFVPEITKGLSVDDTNLYKEFALSPEECDYCEALITEFGE